MMNVRPGPDSPGRRFGAVPVELELSDTARSPLSTAWSVQDENYNS
jgi:hypothetical protein